MRYDNTRKSKDKSGKRYYKTILYPDITPKEDDIYIFTRAGDRLDLLANRFYKDSSLWWVIAQANGIGNGKMYVEAGIQIRIPPKPINLVSSIDSYNRDR